MPATMSALPGAPLSAHREHLAVLEARALEELHTAWSELSDILAQQRAAHESDQSARGPSGQAAPGDASVIAALLARRAATVQRCLSDPLTALERAGPERRADSALTLHARTYETWIRLLPESVELNGPQAIDLASAWGRQAREYTALRLRKDPRRVPLRAHALQQAQRAASDRALADSQILAAFVDGVRQVGRCWSLASIALDASVDESIGRRQIDRTAARVDAARIRVQRRLDRAIARRRALDARVLPALATAALGAVLRGREPATASIQRPHEGMLPDSKPALDELRARLALEKFEDAVLRALDDAIAAAATDTRDLTAAAERLAELLPRHETHPDELVAAVEVTAAGSRLADIDRVVAAEAALLPRSLNVSPTFTHRIQGRKVAPADAARDSYRRVIRPAFSALFEQVEAEQRDIAGDMTRARDVVEFAARAVRAGDASAPVVGEAVTNAVALLRHRQSAPLPQPPVLPAGAAVCQAAHDVRVALFGGRIERWTHDATRQLERGLPVATAALIRGIASRLGRAGRAVERTSHRFLARIGWRPDPSSGVVDIRVRPLLPDAFAADATAGDMPALYRHLFRSDPVRDVRFLVGRTAELAAIGDARARWEAGHSAALLITGERGSGKTSLINCALNGPLAGLPVSYGEFNERVLTPADLRVALAAIVGAPAPDQLEDHLMSTPRVVVLEEVERTFLRHLGHYEAVRALARLVSATGSSVLWIVVLNRVAFSFLDAATGLGQRFSHRINASTATADEIRQAILIRHNLSGLRLRFEPPSALARQRFGRRIDPERAFFEMTARYSAGVYRTAFSIWLGHIAEIRDGLFSVRAPEVLDLLPVIADLSPADLFSLVAFMQHGSLTAEEHATVFQQRIDISSAQLDELAARDIIASDPGRPGYRVRPEAMSVVQEALYRRNLL